MFCSSLSFFISALTVASDAPCNHYEEFMIQIKFTFFESYQLLEVLERLGLLVDLVLEVLGHEGLVQVGVEEEGRQVQVDLLGLE